MHKLFTVCTEQVRSPYTEHAACGLPSPTLLEGEVRSDQAQAQQVVTTHSPLIVTECLLTRSMLIKMYIYAIYSWFRIGTILSVRKHVYEFITTLSSLMNPFSLIIGEPNSRILQKKKNNNNKNNNNNNKTKNKKKKKKTQPLHLKDIQLVFCVVYRMSEYRLIWNHCIAKRHELNFVKKRAFCMEGRFTIKNTIYCN